MKIEFVPAYSDRALFLRLAKDYVESLRKADELIVWDEPTWMKATWDSWFIVEDRTIQGFIITQEVDFKVYNKLLYIEEFYIVPEARRKKIGFSTIEEIDKTWSGDVFFYVLNRNYGAKAFWEYVERKLEWKKINRPEIREEIGCELMVFEKGVTA